MLNRDSYIKIVFILSVIFFAGCNQKESNNKYHVISKYYKSSISKKIWQLANDSIKSWKKSNLQSWKYDPSKGENVLDTTVCVNNNGNKAVMAILSHDFSPNAKLEAIGFFYGFKIKEEWYFFTGATCYLPRKNYTKDIHTPLSFAELHEIAMKEVFSGYLVEKKTKKDMGWWKNIFAPEYSYSYEINDKWFDDHFKTSWGYYKNDKFITPSTQREWDSLYIDKALSVWRK
ncbi:hypothetical protein [Paludibacter sp.]|uniref:hypothetical protein n=1 Tax=Paludibacter sp. TaxID=1898105 RepID=UPI001355F32D|nr:hypothetical protein [Paludibacter sp.]MTK54372.1 hypothetical protein [Paludibacter sp.]